MCVLPRAIDGAEVTLNCGSSHRLYMLFKRYGRRANVRASDIMSVPPVTAKPSDTLLDAARLMVEGGVGSLIVVDDEGRIIGIVTERDLVTALSRGLPCAGGRVADVMSRNVVTVRPDDGIDVVVGKMRDFNIRHVPVVDGEGRPLGMVSARNVIDVGASLIGLFTQL